MTLKEDLLDLEGELRILTILNPVRPVTFYPISSESLEDNSTNFHNLVLSGHFVSKKH